MAFLVTMGILALATVTALVAERRGQDPGIWFVLGAAVPVVSLLLVLGSERRTATDGHHREWERRAVHNSAVAGYLAAGGDASAAEVGEGTGHRASTR